MLPSNDGWIMRFIQNIYFDCFQFTQTLPRYYAGRFLINAIV